MNVLDRNIAPLAHKPSKINVQEVDRGKLKNGIPLFTLKAGSQDITRIEFIFRAGMYYQPATLIASATNNLLETGSSNFTADQISEGIDFYGSFLELNVEQDFSVITIYSLNKYLEETLRYVQEVICMPTFPENEFEIYVGNKRQKFQINSKKVNVLARRHFTKNLFGPNHPYGIDVVEKDFDRLNRKEITEFYSKKYTPENCMVIVSGNFPNHTETILNQLFGDWKSEVALDHVPYIQPVSNSGEFIIQQDDSVQSAIKMGRLLFNKTHPDYCAFQVLNTVLGGYFGSRLMANIREEKGYTYGIGSGISNLVHTGYFSISTEVGTDVTRDAIKEIHHELKRLREEPIPQNELETVRNYILGQFQRSVDGPFALADKFRNIEEYGLNYDFYNRYFDIVSSVTALELQTLANKYLREEDMLVCIAGKL